MKKSVEVNDILEKGKRIFGFQCDETKKNLLYVQEAGYKKKHDVQKYHHNKLKSFLIFVVTEGNGSIYYDGVQKKLRAGDIAFVDCSKTYFHQSSKDEPWEYTWLHFYGKGAGYYYKSITDSVGFIIHPADIMPFVKSIYDIIQIYSSSESVLKTDISASAKIINILNDFWEYGSEDGRVNDNTETKIIEIHDYIMDNYMKKISLDMLEEKFYLSRFHMSREYKKRYGITIIQYLTSLRVSKAKLDLRFTNMSIEEIAVECGFSNASYFGKIFRKYESMTPSEYRNTWLA